MDTSTVLGWKLDIMGLRGFRRDLLRLIFWRRYIRRGGLSIEAETERLTGRAFSVGDARPERRLEVFEALFRPLLGTAWFRTEWVRHHFAHNAARNRARPSRARRRKPDVRRPARVVDTVRVR